MQAISKGGKVNDIQSLTSEVSLLTESVSWWNTAVIVMLVVAALAATGLVVTQLIAVKRAERLAEAQEKLGVAKEAQLAIELKEKDKQIAEANARGEAAKAEAAKANERILEMQKLRRLEKDKAAALMPLLKSDWFQKEPKPSLRIGAVADSEAQMYAMDFQRLFESCGVNIYPTTGGLPNECVQLEPNADGLVMTIKNINSANQAFPRFQRLMVSIGLNFGVEEDSIRRDNEAMLTVLRKPS